MLDVPLDLPFLVAWFFELPPLLACALFVFVYTFLTFAIYETGVFICKSLHPWFLKGEPEALSMTIPPKKDTVEDRPKKFLVQTSTSVYLKLQQEAADRGVDLLTLAGAVLSSWVAGGCPDSFCDRAEV